MSQEATVPQRRKNKHLSFLDELIPYIEQTIPHEEGFEEESILAQIETLKENFDKDIARVEEVTELLLEEDIAAYGQRCTSVFSRWEKEGGGPSLPAILYHAWGALGLESGAALEKSAFIAAILAEIPNDLIYHGNEHYRKVLFHVIRLIATHRNIHNDDDLSLTEQETATLLIAGITHDLGHEGGDNLQDGIYTPGKMEQRSFDIARPYFEACGLESSALRAIETLVFCTDITFFAGDNSPCVRMRRIYDYYFSDDENAKDESVLNYIIGKLRLFDENPKMALMAMLLHEADIGTSAGLSYEQSIKETICIMEERGMQTAGPKTLIAFFKEQLDGHMKTDSAKALFESAMMVIMDQALEDYHRGRETFYQD